jgi:AbrB family looped-hinge helix DNA binding protein
MQQGDKRIIGSCYGTAVLGPRGQLVIPAEARKELGIGTGSKLLVFGHLQGRGFFLIKAEAAEELLNIMSNQLVEVARMVKENRATDTETKGEGNAS